MPPLGIAVGLKMYFDRAQAVDYCSAAAEIARRSGAVRSGAVRLVVFPDFLALEACRESIGDAPVSLGAQNLCLADRGAFTGEISGSDLAALGCAFAEIGHAERRALLGEDDEVVAAKVVAAQRNGLVPLLCVGETHRTDPHTAARLCVEQLDAALELVGKLPELWVAYEPHWAIGAREPAPTELVRYVTESLRTHGSNRAGSVSVVYGGSAGLGTLTALGRSVDGLFLGRFAHDPAVLSEIVTEAENTVASRDGCRGLRH
jgi:triosephosphate isomerase